MDKKYILARTLRKKSTNAENIIWNIVRNRKLNNLKFKRQVPIGNYIVDFHCEEKGIIIELDGGHHNTLENTFFDNERTAFLESKGYRVYRFWNNEVENNLEGVYEKLIEIIKQGQSPHPQSLSCEAREAVYDNGEKLRKETKTVIEFTIEISGIVQNI